MLLYSKALAWYGATPEGYKTSRIEMARTGTRTKTSKDSDVEHKIPTEIHLPDIPSALGYLLGFFFSSGQCMQYGMGIAPLTWQEIKAYNEANDLEMCNWEMALIKKMSEAYCNEYAHSSDPKRPCAYEAVIEQNEETELAKAMMFRKVLDGFKKTKG